MDWEGRVLLLAIVADPLLLPLNLTLPVSLLQEVSHLRQHPQHFSPSSLQRPNHSLSI